MIHRHTQFGTLFLVVAVVLSAALLLQADAHVAQAQSTTRSHPAEYVYSLIEVDPLEFDEDVGTVRFGIQAVTIGAAAPTRVGGYTFLVYVTLRDQTTSACLAETTYT